MLSPVACFSGRACCRSARVVYRFHWFANSSTPFSTSECSKEAPSVAISRPTSSGELCPGHSSRTTGRRCFARCMMNRSEWVELPCSHHCAVLFPQITNQREESTRPHGLRRHPITETIRIRPEEFSMASFPIDP